MVNFDANNKHHKVLVLGVLKYLKTVGNKAFKGEHLSFNVEAFKIALGIDESTKSPNASLKAMRDEGKLTLVNLLHDKIVSYVELTYVESVRISSEESVEFSEELLNKYFLEVIKTKVLPLKIAQLVFDKIFYMPPKKTAESSFQLPENFLWSEVCKEIEFESEQLFVSVITATLTWAFKNRDEIKKSVEKNGSKFKYITTSDTAKDNIRNFNKFVVKNGLQESIKFADIKSIKFNEGIEIDSTIRIPIANDIVIYSNIPLSIQEGREKFIFETNIKQHKTIALVGTFPQEFDQRIENEHNYYDILISPTEGGKILTWFNDVWEKITTEESEL